MNTTPTLLPCPFCGNSKNLAILNERPDHSGGYFIACHACEASTGLRFACGDDPKPLLTEQWNRRAALTQGAGAVEPVAWMDDGQTRYGGTGDAEQRVVTTAVKALLPPGRRAHYIHPLYAAPPAQQLQQAVARALEPIQQAIRDYHYALDTRQHGGMAQINAFDAICGHLDMDWQPGQEAAIRLKGTHP